MIDLRVKFEMPAREATQKTCIVVVEAHSCRTGLLVDQVREVLDISSQQIDPAPRLGAEMRTDFILGIARSEERVSMLLNIDRILTFRENAEMCSTVNAEATAA